jgi:hypothetical protein
MRRPALLLVVAALVACGVTGCNERQNAVIQFYGHVPYYSKQKDERYVKAYCPHCGEQVKWKDAKCPKKKCGGAITWPEKVPCGFCKDTNQCEVCVMNRMTKDPVKNKCWQCKGKGYFPPTNAPCANCDGNKTCPACKGEGKCDFCEGKQYVIESKKAVRDPEAAE